MSTSTSLTTNPNDGLEILISGIGIAGPVLAYWLLRANPHHSITLLERDTALRTSGQSIDIRQAAVDVVDLMGLLPQIKTHTTTEEGIQFVDGDNNVLAGFGASGDKEQQSFTSEFEIFRGDLVNILYGTVKDHPRVSSIFGDRVISYTQDEEGKGKVDVVLEKGGKRKVDLLIACDGLSSRIRNIALGTMDEPRKHFRAFNNYAAYFTMPSLPRLDGQKMASWYNSTGGRVFFIRPDPRPGLCRANIVRQLLAADTSTNERYRGALKSGMEEYRNILLEDFEDAGWFGKDILEGLKRTEDLYASETAQVQAPTTVVGRVAFVGDAGYCPTPLTGMGTSLAIIGAYILAGEISKITTPTHNAVVGDQTSGKNEEGDEAGRRSGDGVVDALKKYDSIIGPFAKKVQNIPTSVPAYLNPQSAWGLWVVRNILWAVGKSGVVGLVSKLAGSTALGKKGFELPKYTWGEL